MRSRHENSQDPTHSISYAIIAVILLFLAYLVLWWSMPGLPFLDMPNHLARAVIMSDLLFGGGHQFGEAFSLHLAAVPYVLGDLGFTVLVWLGGATAAGRLWVVLSFASLPTAVLVFMKVQRFRWPSIMLALLMSFYLATDWFFTSGFMSFRLAVAFTILCIGFLCSILQRQASPGLAAGYVCSLVVGYFTHLSTLIFVSAAVAALVLINVVVRRRMDLRRETLLGAPLVVLWLLYMTANVTSMQGSAIHGGIVEKITRIATLFARLDVRIEAALFLTFVLTCLSMCRHAAREIHNERVVMYAVLAAAFFGTFFVLPRNQGTIFDIDSRALSLAWTFLMFAAIAIWEATSSAHFKLFLASACVLATLNLSGLAVRLRPDDAVLRQVRAVAKLAPSGSRLLPVNTLKGKDGIQPYGHAGSWATIDRGALTPYLFGGDAGDSMSYFRYRDRPAAPWIFKCTLGDCRIDWAAVRTTYDFVLVIGAFEPTIMGIPATIVAKNPSATMLQIVR